MWSEVNKMSRLNVMKRLMVVLAFAVSFGVSALGLSKFNDLLGSSDGGVYTPSTAAYWNPDKPGMGMGVSVQPSELAQSGYVVFAGVYTYKPDGSQAWYSIQGE